MRAGSFRRRVCGWSRPRRRLATGRAACQRDRLWQLDGHPPQRLRQQWCRGAGLQTRACARVARPRMPARYGRALISHAGFQLRAVLRHRRYWPLWPASPSSENLAAPYPRLAYKRRPPAVGPHEQGSCATRSAARWRCCRVECALGDKLAGARTHARFCRSGYVLAPALAPAPGADGAVY
jgi:hypothetical protein